MTQQFTNNQTQPTAKRKPDFRLVQKSMYLRFDKDGRSQREAKFIELAAGWNEVDQDGNEYISWSSSGVVPQPDIDGLIKYMQFATKNDEPAA